MLVITQFTRPPAVRLVRLDGELDLFSALQLRGVLNDAVESGCSTLTIDAEDVGFVDGSALGLLERAWLELRGGNVVVDVINASTRFCWLVDLIGLQDTFRLADPTAERVVLDGIPL